MKSFNIIFEKFCKNLLKEGGNAFNDVSRIKREIINDVVFNFKNTILKKFIDVSNDENVFLLGSTGKKKDSGDIDIGINANALKDDVLLSLMKINQECASFNIISYINTISFNMLHIRYPQENGLFVQIDLLLTKYPEFTKFFMFSPTEEESRYKGAHRNILLKSIAMAVSMNNAIRDEDGNLLKWDQIDINDTGVFREQKTLIDENGNKILYKNTNEPLELEYAKVIKSVPITHNIKQTINMFVGDFEESEIDTFEKLYDIVINNEKFKFRSEENIKNILNICIQKFNAAKKRLVFPTELNQ